LDNRFVDGSPPGVTRACPFRAHGAFSFLNAGFYRHTIFDEAGIGTGIGIGIGTRIGTGIERTRGWGMRTAWPTPASQ